VNRDHTRLLLAAVVTTLLLWASAFVAIRISIREYGPGPLALLRFLVASVSIAAYALVVPGQRLRPVPGRDLLLFLALGFVGIAVYHAALNAGERTVNAGTASLLINTSPFFTAFLAILFLGERLGPRRWAGMGIGFAGASLVSIDAAGGIRLEPNVLLVLLAAISGACWITCQKPLLERYRPLEVNAYGMFAATLFLLVFLPGLLRDAALASTAATLAAVYLGVFPAAVAYVTWSYMVARMPASRAAGTLYAVPPLAYLIAWALLGERPGPLAIAGGAIALTGVALVSAGRR